jgi:pyruvate dehydrogenase (quinone)
MSKTVGDFLVQRLQDWGVRYLFGYPGDGINGMFGALNRAGGKIDFIQARHEEMAAFMASAYAKILRSSWRLHRNLRTRRLASDHRAL